MLDAQCYRTHEMPPGYTHNEQTTQSATDLAFVDPVLHDAKMGAVLSVGMS